MYLAIATRPDLCYAAGNASQYLENPTDVYVNVVKIILKHINGTISSVIMYICSGNNRFKISGLAMQIM